MGMVYGWDAAVAVPSTKAKGVNLRPSLRYPLQKLRVDIHNSSERQVQVLEGPKLEERRDVQDLLDVNIIRFVIRPERLCPS